MAGSTLGIDVNALGQEVRRRLAAMAPDAGAGSVRIDHRKTALGVKIGRDADIGGTVHVGRTVMAGSADRIYRAETKGGMRKMGAYVGRLTVAGGTALSRRRCLGIQRIHNGLDLLIHKEGERPHSSGIIGDSRLNIRSGGRCFCGNG